MGANFGAKAGLDVWVEGEGMDCPCHCRSGSFMAGGKEGHHLIDEIFVGEAAGSEGDREDVDAVFLLRRHALFFRGDEVSADGADFDACGREFKTLFDGEVVEDPGGEELADHG